MKRYGVSCTEKGSGQFLGYVLVWANSKAEAIEKGKEERAHRGWKDNPAFFITAKEC